eukprot:CAMPEP_0167755204 /NCGR_PEP_ID=MMETSP0110_2-20121227/8694_1 /TAXON_ID=629695 /ORGANISM="Gymnochlora sp., Strain CCMP2014" /LENGTH=383 /DNA_ID=CAMNT_0007641165 /DNA_START=55 /DNA_END=1206 /DNA_ORIENTATION=+
MESELSERTLAFLNVLYGDSVPNLDELKRDELRNLALKLADESWGAIQSRPGGRKRNFDGVSSSSGGYSEKAIDQKASQSSKRFRPDSYLPDDVDKVKEHYNVHGRKVQTQAERRKGVSHPLKKFHNNVKRQMIRRFCQDNRGNFKLLDIACGRGGDLFKWKAAGIAYVRGIDLSPLEIDEAKRRYAESRGKLRGLKVDFEQSDDCGRKLLPGLNGQYDAVTCMFAAHYFFRDEATCKHFLHNVSAALRPGGYFFGCVPDGKKVVTKLMRTKKYENSVLCLERLWEKSYKAFGSRFIFKIRDTVTDGDVGSTEYLVFQSVFKSLAKTYDLEPVLDYRDSRLEELLERTDRDELFKHFAPEYKLNDLHSVSHLNATFCFRKKSL